MLVHKFSRGDSGREVECEARHPAGMVAGAGRLTVHFPPTVTVTSVSSPVLEHQVTHNTHLCCLV